MLITTTISVGVWGAELEVRGDVDYESHEGWTCEMPEVRRPGSRDWYRIRNVLVASDASAALCRAAEEYNPYLAGDLDPPDHYL